MGCVDGAKRDVSLVRDSDPQGTSIRVFGQGIDLCISDYPVSYQGKDSPPRIIHYPGGRLEGRRAQRPMCPILKLKSIVKRSTYGIVGSIQSSRRCTDCLDVAMW